MTKKIELADIVRKIVEERLEAVQWETIKDFENPLLCNRKDRNGQTLDLHYGYKDFVKTMAVDLYLTRSSTLHEKWLGLVTSEIVCIPSGKDANTYRGFLSLPAIKRAVPELSVIHKANGPLDDAHAHARTHTADECDTTCLAIREAEQ